MNRAASLTGFLAAGLAGVLVIVVIGLIARGPSVTTVGVLAFAAGVIVAWTLFLRSVRPTIFSARRPFQPQPRRQHVITITLVGIVLPLALTIAAGIFFGNWSTMLLAGFALAVLGVGALVAAIVRR